MIINKFNTIGSYLIRLVKFFMFGFDNRHFNAKFSKNGLHWDEYGNPVIDYKDEDDEIKLL